MNFFKRRKKQTTLSVLDNTNTNDVENIKPRSNSGGLKRSVNVSFNQDYHTSETKIFDEPLNGTENLPKNNTPNHNTKTVRINTESEEINGHVSNTLGSSDDFASYIHENNEELEMSSNLLHDDADPERASEKQRKENNNNGKLAQVSVIEEMSPVTLALIGAIVRGEKSEVKKMLTENPELLETPDSLGRTPFMYCVLSDRLDCAKLLLKMKCKPDHVDKAGRSALHLAAQKANYKFLELLYEQGGNIEVKDNEGHTPLHLITRNRKNVKCLEFMLRHLSPGMAEVTDNQNRTALHWSASFNNVEYVKLLIKYNCNTAISDDEGRTPLHWAANTHDPSAVTTMKALLDSSPSALNWQNYKGETALHFAVAHKNIAAVKFLLQFEQEKCEVDRLDNSFRTPLHLAAQLGNINIVKLLLSAGAKNSISDGHGATPFLYAALYNNPEVVIEMIEHDRSVLDQADIEGRTALMWAAAKGANDVIETLLKLGNAQHGSQAAEGEGKPSKEGKKSLGRLVVDINRADNKGNTALHMAAYSGCARSAELLLNYNARHDLQNNMNHTPLFGACEKGDINVVKHLLDYNASISLRDIEDRTPLHWAALGGHAEVCDLLIKKGLDPDVRDGIQRSPLHCAAFGGFINCMNLLLESKANVDLQDQEGLSALHWAAQSGHLDASKLLLQCSAFPNLMEFTEERLTPLDHALLNGSDEVAQYLIEQGALSSETIRAIAAARIQACYRGYQVRKAFLHRKNMLIKHEILKSEKDKNRFKKKPNASSSDQLDCVGQEPLPTSQSGDPPIGGSLYSGDESRPDTLDEATADVTTVQSSKLLISTDVPLSKIVDSEGEDNFESNRSEEKCEDSNESRGKASLVFSGTVVVCKEKNISVTEEPDAAGVSGDVQLGTSETNNPLNKVESTENSSAEKLSDPLNVIVLPTALSDSSNKFGSSDLTLSESVIHTEESAAVNTDTTCKSGAQRSKERRKKKRKRPRQCKTNQPSSTSSDATSRQKETIPRHSEETRKLRNGRKTSSASQPISTPLSTDGELTTENVVVTSDTVSTTSDKDSRSSFKVKQVEKPPREVDAANVSNEIAAECDHEIKTQPSNVNIYTTPTNRPCSKPSDDWVNVGDDNKISLDKVSGLAYSSSETFNDISLHGSLDKDLGHSSHFNSDLSLSEYIESLMSMSLSERKILIMLQRNRKYAFKQANSAAGTIQKGWRRYLKAKYPNRVFETRKENRKEKIVLPVQSRTPPDSRVQSAKGSSHPGEDSATLGRESSERTPQKSSPRSSVASKTEKIVDAKKKKPRPHTSHASVDTRQISPQYASEHVEQTGAVCLRASIASDLTSESGSLKSTKSKRARPRTMHGTHRRHNLVLSSRDDVLNRRVQQLCKVYGQTLVLQDMYAPEKKGFAKNHFKTVTAPSVRPKTSRASADFDCFQFNDPRLYDPVTAVQSYPASEWKSSVKKKSDNRSDVAKSTPSRLKRKRSLRSSKSLTEPGVSYVPLQWHKIHGDSKTSWMHNSNKTSSAAPTRFSYNMRNTNY